MVAGLCLPVHPPCGCGQEGWGWPICSGALIQPASGLQAADVSMAEHRVGASVIVLERAHYEAAIKKNSKAQGLYEKALFLGEWVDEFRGMPFTQQLQVPCPNLDAMVGAPGALP